MKQIEQLKEIIDIRYPTKWKKEIVLHRHDYLIQEGEYSTGFYFIKKGSLHVFLNLEHDIQTMRFGYPSSFISALDSFIGNCPTKFSIQAIKKTTLVQIYRDDFFHIIDIDEEIRQIWMSALSVTLYQHIEREIDLLCKTPEERYYNLLRRSPHVFQEIPNKYIASYLRMAPETLSRLLKS
ncbi:MAG: Crp/Fnr family transcriptional regulator [Bacteroidetes bacterium]|nr:Crp/Fnr family transcriptional regulator [Bacteroidota bacterium]